jgi:hypothetical protein
MRSATCVRAAEDAFASTAPAAGGASGAGAVTDAHVRTAWSLFAGMHAALTPDNAERLTQWLGKNPLHVRALDIALTEWGLVQSGHPVGNARGGSGNA